MDQIKLRQQQQSKQIYQQDKSNNCQDKQINQQGRIQKMYYQFQQLQNLLHSKRKRKQIQKIFLTQQKQKPQKYNNQIMLQKCRSQYEKSIKKVSKIYKQQKTKYDEQLQQIKTKLFQKQEPQNEEKSCKYSQVLNKRQPHLKKVQEVIEPLVEYQKNLNLQLQTKNHLSHSQAKTINYLKQKIKEIAMRLQNHLWKEQLFPEKYKLCQKQKQYCPEIHIQKKEVKDDHNQYFTNLQKLIKQVTTSIEENQIKLMRLKQQLKEVINNKSISTQSLNLQINMLNIQFSKLKFQKLPLFKQSQVAHLSNCNFKQKRISQNYQEGLLEIKQKLKPIPQQQNITKQKTQFKQAISKMQNQQSNQQKSLEQFLDYKSQIGGSQLSSIKANQIDQPHQIDMQLQANFQAFNQNNQKNILQNPDQKKQIEKFAIFNDFNQEYLEEDSINSET